MRESIARSLRAVQCRLMVGPEPGLVAPREHTSLEERFGALQVVRLVIVGLVIIASVAVPGELGMSTGRVLPLSLAYLAACLLGQVADSVRARSDRRSGGPAEPGIAVRTSFRHMLLPVDSFYLAALTVPSGGAQSDFIWLFTVQLIAVTLLASPRTGVRMALCDSVLLLAITVLRLAVPLGQMLGSSQVDTPSAAVVAVRISGFWAVALCTAYFSGLSERDLRRSKAQLDALTQMAADMEESIEAGGDASQIAAVLLRSLTAPFGLRRAVVIWERKARVSAARTARVLGPPGAPVAGDVEETLVEPLALGLDALEAPVAQRALRAGRPVLIRSFADDRDSVLAGVVPDAHNVVVVPLKAGLERQGLVVGEYGPLSRRRVNKRSIEMMTRFTAHAALALSNADLRQEVAKLAATDSLTGLPNRRALMTALHRELSRSARSGEPLSVAVIDVDHFKRVNDAFGHLAGDEVLREVAGAMVSALRDVDIVARYGGEEFAVVLPNCRSDQALNVVERMRRAVSRTQTVTRVTVSAGLATIQGGPGDGSPGEGSRLGEGGQGEAVVDGEQLLAAADEALYVSKNAGRDRVTVAGPVLPSPAQVLRF
ncbi:MAG TPA: GGDEF domain-containing protein [Acidimicrobiales bacterium]|nr:GGDEF domain-containing protein [Acidimicrobiales bacterium]